MAIVATQCEEQPGSRWHPLSLLIVVLGFLFSTAGAQTIEQALRDTYGEPQLLSSRGE